MSISAVGARILTSFLSGAKAFVATLTTEPPEKAKPAVEEKPKAAADPSPAAAYTATLREGLEKIRADLAGYGTAIGLVGGSITVATVFATFDDLYPLPNGWRGLTWVALGLVIAAGYAPAALTRLFFVARRRVVVEPSAVSPPVDPDPKNLDAKELELLARPLNDLAAGEGLPNARAVEQRAQRLERVAARASERGATAVATAAQGEATRLNEAIVLATVAGVVRVVERRSITVYRSGVAIALAALALIANAGLFAMADWSLGERERITHWIACAKEPDTSVPAEVCADLDPRSGWRPGSTPSPTTPPNQSPETPTPPPGAIIERLNSCAALPDTGGVARELRNRALAVCAGLPPTQSAPSPTTS